MKVTVQWTTLVQYERQIEIDDDEVAAHGGDVRAYLDENVDEILADLEEDFDGTGLTADVSEREVVDVDYDEPEDEDDD